MSLSQAQLDARMNGLGGSDGPAALGLSPWKTPYQLWREKKGLDIAPARSTEAMEMGDLLEDVVAEKFRRSTGLTLQRVNATMYSPEHPFMLAHIDRAVVNPTISKHVRWNGKRLTTDMIFEAKTTGAYNSGDWGPQETDQIPGHYLVQVSHYLIVTGAELCHLGVLLGGQEFRRYVIRRDPDLLRMIVDGEREFWRRVVEDDPPEPTTSADIRLRYPRDDGSEIEATPAVAAAVERLRALREQGEQVSAQIEAAEDHIKAFLGANAALTVRGTVVATWRASSPARRFDSTAFKVAHPDLYDNFVREGDPTRRFLLKG